MRVAVETWCVDLVDLPPPSGLDLCLLSDDERARHAGFLIPEPARIFATTRIALRRLLGRRLGRRPEELRLEVDVRGKPRVADAPSAFFNVSHGPTLALIAFCDDAPVGIDVEPHAALVFDASLAAIVCTPSEAAWLRAGAATADAQLTRLWTRKEAALKACGAGLILPMADLELSTPFAGRGAAAVAGAGRIVWCDLALPPGAVGAVAAVSEAAAIDVALRSYAP